MDSIEELRKIRVVNLLLVLLLGFFTFLFTYLPIEFKLIGASGSIRLAESMCLVNGILLGPFYGLISSAIGVGVRCIMNGYFDLFSLIPLFGAIFSGLLSRNHWKISSILLGSSIFCWYLTPGGVEFWFLPYFSVVCLFIILISRDKIHEMLYGKWMPLSLFIISFCGTLFVHMIEEVLVLSYIPSTPSAWMMAIKIYPFERLALSIVSVAIASLFIYLIKAIHEKEELEEKEILEYAKMAREKIKKR
ncbi:MAG: hypothetical protein MASP_00109 [Candidatus Methanolliviera sp. GoM_asphalt]|nr:MAG: hypothetical protein MASP_00109 [Candidatus Methanolliviera sp. GoM_asphalt]